MSNKFAPFEVDGIVYRRPKLFPNLDDDSPGVGAVRSMFELIDDHEDGECFVCLGFIA